MSKLNYSFIIPHHNCPELLQRCVDSIPARDDIEVIIIDDNSDPEKKPNIVRNNVQIFSLTADNSNGAGHARNVGFQQAKGKWLLFADSDDYYVENFVDELDKFVDSDIDVLYFNYQYVDNYGNPIADNMLQNVISNYEGGISDTEYIKFQNNTPWTKMVSREYVLKHEMYFEEVPNGNDVLFSLLVGSYSNKMSVSSKRLYNYIRTLNSIGTKKQSFEDIVCRLVHIIKHNAFNNYIGHPEWNASLLYNFCMFIKRNPINIFALFNLLRVYISNDVKNQWVNIIIAHQV